MLKAASQVPFALGRIIDLIYSLDQLKTQTEEEQKALINERLKKVRFRFYFENKNILPCYFLH